MQRDQMDYIARRIREEDWAAVSSATLEARQAHAEMALFYRNRLMLLKRVQMAIAA